MNKINVFCNPVNINYRYQFIKDERAGGALQINREAADPSMICFKGRYYIFASMTLGVWVSDDLVTWENHRLPDDMPLLDYAPDVRVLGDYVYFCASNRDKSCDRYRTKDILNGPYEKIEGTFPYWDPNLFVDDDGRIYFYWGCSNVTPIYGVELDRDTMLPVGATADNPMGRRVELVSGHPDIYGFERVGDDNSLSPATDEEIETAFKEFLQAQHITQDKLPAEYIPAIKGMFSNMPYVEGPWMDKHNDRYYLQYAFGGTQYNTYGDGVYVGTSPLGPFTLSSNNPYSYVPGGFLQGAGHGSTMTDISGNIWHTSTVRVSVNHMFERRVGLWPAGFDEDGELFCNQRYGDWPYRITGAVRNPWERPEWYLLSYGKDVTVSSTMEGYSKENVVDENIQTLFRPSTVSLEEYVILDLKKEYDVHAIQINFGDKDIDISCPGHLNSAQISRYIDDKTYPTRWLLEGSLDGKEYFVIEDKRNADTDLSHDLVVSDEGFRLRFVRLSNMQVPYSQIPALSGIRVFGKGDGSLPDKAQAQAKRTDDLDFTVKLLQDDALGHMILWGEKPDKLYHSCMVYGKDAVEKEKRIGALVKNREYFVRVDSFNENGITEGEIFQLK